MSYNFLSAAADEVPILISVPHCGVAFPEEITMDFNQPLISAPDDTDWFVHQLYDFAPAMGMSMITAKYSRWVIDLNRPPDNKPLYTDGRIITGLCPVTTFLGEDLYNDHRTAVDHREADRRLQHYYWPYHQKISTELDRLKKKFGIALIWDCHSIRQYVQTIYPEKFPDLILGDGEGTSADSEISALAIAALHASTYTVRHNHPFKGGYITRHYGKPVSGIHALQLEMTKVQYMSDDERRYDDQRALRMRTLLADVFSKLTALLSRRSS